MRAEDKALGDIRVVELAVGIAGPIVGQLLADFGADVVKVELPAGDPSRALPGFLTWNRGKRSVVVGADGGGRARVEALLIGADVCIVNDRRPSSALGVDLEAARRANPGLLVVDVAPFEGETRWHGGGESESLLAAATGVGLRQSSCDGGPVEFVTPLLLHVQGLWAATCVLAALLERERSGHGQSLTVSGVHAVSFVSAASLTKDPAQPEQVTNVGSGGPNPFYTRYRTADDRWFFAGALVHAMQLRYLDVLGLQHLLDDPRSGGGTDTMITPAHRDWVRARFTEVFATRTATEWEDRFVAHDVPCSPLLTREEWFHHPQVAAAGLRTSIDDPVHGKVDLPGIVATASRTPGCIRSRAPQLGEHTASVQPWPARSAPKGDATSRRGPLEGVRVVNLGTYVAGPYAGVLLAELGADVVKVEPLTGDPFRATGFTYNRGMRSLAVDLHRPEGQEVLHDLVRTSDAVIDNARLGVLERLGADYETLVLCKPDIVASSMSSYGEGGPLATRPAFDLVLQAASGLMMAQGSVEDPVIVTVSINDVTSAVLVGFGVCLGLFERARSGRGQRISSSLAAAATFLQDGDYVDYPGRPPAPTGGTDFRGHDPLHQYVPVSDGWIRVDAPTGTDPGLVHSATVGRLDREWASAWLDRLGIPATPARPFAEVRLDDVLLAKELVHTFKRSDGSTYTTPGRFARFDRTPVHDQLGLPGVGEHTAEVLTQLGVPVERQDALLAAGITVQGGATDPVIFNYR